MVVAKVVKTFGFSRLFRIAESLDDFRYAQSIAESLDDFRYAQSIAALQRGSAGRNTLRYLGFGPGLQWIRRQSNPLAIARPTCLT